MRQLSARSVVLSLLLGSHPPELSSSALVAAGELFEISEPTLRVALTRMVANGDLERTESTYRLSDRLLMRQRRQDADLTSARPWNGNWDMVVVTSTGRSAADRADLRTTLTDLRLAELREGTWLRPANLDRPLPQWPENLISTFTTTPAEDPAELAGRLWDLTGWNRTGHELRTALDQAQRPADRLALAAAVVRHLRTDPALPAELLPPDWIAPELRASYIAYQRELIESGLALTVDAS